MIPFTKISNKARARASYCLDRVKFRTDVIYWRVRVYVRKPGGTFSELRFHFPDIPADYARGVRNEMLAHVEAGKIASREDWNDLKRRIRAALVDQKLIVSTAGGYVPAFFRSAE